MRYVTGRWLALWFVLTIFDLTLGWTLRPVVVWAWNVDIQLIKGLGR